MTHAQYDARNNSIYLDEEDIAQIEEFLIENNYGIDDNTLAILAKKHERARKTDAYTTMAKIECLLTELNFHEERDHLRTGNYAVFGIALNAEEDVEQRKETNNMTTTGQKKLDEMNKYLTSKDGISDYAGNKAAFKSASTKFLNQLLSDVKDTLRLQYDEPPLSDSKVSFNPGGPAVAGDPSLYFMTCKNKGVAVYISEGFKNDPYKIMYRNITSMTDYRGAVNNWLAINEPYENLVKRISKAAL